MNDEQLVDLVRKSRKEGIGRSLGWVFFSSIPLAFIVPFLDISSENTFMLCVTWYCGILLFLQVTDS